MAKCLKCGEYGFSMPGIGKINANGWCDSCNEEGDVKIGVKPRKPRYSTKEDKKNLCEYFELGYGSRLNQGGGLQEESEN